MRDLLSWNVSLGRWSDVQVRLHVSFLVLLTVVLYLGTGRPEARTAAPALVGMSVLFLSVVAHELGHCLAAWRCDGRVDRVVLGPWGGLTYVCPTRAQNVEVFISLSGPAVNLAISLAATLTLVGLGQPVATIIQPFALPIDDGSMNTIRVFYLIAWINWLIVLVNLLPAYPLDGARLLRAAVRPWLGFRSAVVLAWRTGIVTAIALFVAAWALRNSFEEASMACSLLGIFLYFSSWQEAERLHEPDASDELGAFEDRDDEAEEPLPPPAGPLRRWLEGRRRLRLARRLQQERDDEQRVDEVLARLHTLGSQALSPQDRDLLERVSARYRERQRG